MLWKYFLLSSLFFLDLVQLLYASPRSQVHRGLTLRAALNKALEVCPNEANKRKAKIKASIKELEKPLYMAGDPDRKSYKTSYQENPELTDRNLKKICKFENTFSQINSEEINEEGSAEGRDSMSFEAEELEESDATSGVILGSFSVSGSVIFGAGFVLGILLSFLFKYHNFQAQVPSVKVMRRPEL